MAVIYANPTGLFSGTFEGIATTRSSDWVKVKASLITDVGLPVKESFLVRSDDKDLFEQIKALQVGQKYKFFCSVSFQDAREDATTGRSYRAKVQYNLLKVNNG